MASKHLATYLNDHLAGSETALELLAYLESACPGTEEAKAAGELREDVLADRKELEALMARLGISQSAIRKASAWVGEKLAQLKLRADDLAGGDLRLLEATEAIALGVHGKESLWLALAAAAESAPDLQGVDYARLAGRAADQRLRIEAVRLQAARKAFRPDGIE